MGNNDPEGIDKTKTPDASHTGDVSLPAPQVPLLPAMPSDLQQKQSAPSDAQLLQDIMASLEAEECSHPLSQPSSLDHGHG